MGKKLSRNRIYGHGGVTVARGPVEKNAESPKSEFKSRLWPFQNSSLLFKEAPKATTKSAAGKQQQQRLEN